MYVCVCMYLKAIATRHGRLLRFDCHPENQVVDKVVDSWVSGGLLVLLMREFILFQLS